MNKRLMKFIIASTLLFGVVIVHDDVNAQYVKPYYQWNGHTGYNYQFLFDPNFKRALLNDNVTINGMKVATNFNHDDIREGMNAFDMMHSKKQYNHRYVQKRYDTVGYKSLKGRYFLLEIPVQQGKLSMKQFNQHYGKYKIGTNVIKDKSGRVIEQTVTYKTNKGIFEANFDAKNRMISCYISADTTTPY